MKIGNSCFRRSCGGKKFVLQALAKEKKERDKEERYRKYFAFLDFILFFVKLLIRYIKRKFRDNIRDYFKLEINIYSFLSKLNMNNTASINTY